VYPVKTGRRCTRTEAGRALELCEAHIRRIAATAMPSGVRAVPKRVRVPAENAHGERYFAMLLLKFSVKAPDDAGPAGGDIFLPIK
jgi:hypothetical protein